MVTLYSSSLYSLDENFLLDEVKLGYLQIINIRLPFLVYYLGRMQFENPVRLCRERERWMPLGEKHRQEETERSGHCTDIHGC
jgi:hypothetical protein